jgi:hypothetical protein
MWNFGAFLKSLFILYKARVIYLNADGSVLNWDEKQSAETKLPREKVIGKNFSILFTDREEDMACFDAILAAACNKGSVSETLVVFQNGKQVRWRLKINSVRDDAGTVIGYTVEQRAPLSEETKGF